MEVFRVAASDLADVEEEVLAGVVLEDDDEEDALLGDVFGEDEDCSSVSTLEEAGRLEEEDWVEAIGKLQGAWVRGEDLPSPRERQGWSVYLGALWGA